MIQLELYQLKNLLRDMAKLGVAEYIRNQQPAKDLISQREAYRLFQEARVKDWRKRGFITPVRMGSEKNSKLQYSRFELENISYSENLISHINSNQ